MNAEKCANVLGNIFHFETITNDDIPGDYVLSSNYWGLSFSVSCRDRNGGHISISNNSGHRMASCRIDFDEDETSIARTLMTFIGSVLKDMSYDYTYDGTNGILAWPYNCNFAYIDKLKKCMDMNEGESDYQYLERTHDRVESSRKPIKSGFTQRNVGMIMDKLGQCDGIVKTCISICPDSRLEKELDGLQKNIVDVATHAEMLSNGDEKIESSMQGQERGIQAIMDEYGCSREEALEIMNDGITSGCHGKAKKKAKKEIKSTWDVEDEDEEWLHQETAIDSSVNRNHKNIQALYN